MKVKKELLKDILIPVAVLIGALIVWQVAAWITSARNTPLLTFSALIDILKDGRFWAALGGTLLRALIAFISSFSIAFIFALISAGSDVFRRILAPVMTAIRAIPTMAIVLIFILYMSANMTTVFIGMLVLLPTFYAALLPVAQGVSKELIEVALVCGASRGQRLRYVYLPSMAPSAVENGISGLSLALKLVVSAEVLAQTAKSIGMMMQSARAYLETERLVALTIMVVAICIIIDTAGKAAFGKIIDM